LIISCENSQKPTLDTPGTVSWVEKSAEMAADERGVDAISESDGVFLQWYKLRDRGIKYYNIYRKRPNETFFGRIQQINIENATEGRDTTYIDGDSLLNDYQFYYITAENSDGVEGQASDTIRYKLLDKPETTKPNFETVVGMPIFFWSFVTIIPHEFILRIERDFPPFGLSVIHRCLNQICGTNGVLMRLERTKQKAVQNRNGLDSKCSNKRKV
jgi:hypothetical protein